MKSRLLTSWVFLTFFGLILFGFCLWGTGCTSHITVPAVPPPAMTNTWTATNTVTGTPVNPTPTSTATNSPTLTPSNTPGTPGIFTPTSTATNTATLTPSNTPGIPTNTPTPSPTNTITPSPTNTVTYTPTLTPTQTPTSTTTITPTLTSTSTPTPTGTWYTNTPTITPTSSFTNCLTMTFTCTACCTPTATYCAKTYMSGTITYSGSGTVDGIHPIVVSGGFGLLGASVTVNGGTYVIGTCLPGVYYLAVNYYFNSWQMIGMRYSNGGSFSYR